jgi:hypothetical protein
LASIASSAVVWETFSLAVSTSRFYLAEALLPRKGRRGRGWHAVRLTASR